MSEHGPALHLTACGRTLAVTPSHPGPVILVSDARHSGIAAVYCDENKCYFVNKMDVPSQQVASAFVFVCLLTIGYILQSGQGFKATSLRSLTLESVPSTRDPPASGASNEGKADGAASPAQVGMWKAADANSLNQPIK